MSRSLKKAPYIEEKELNTGIALPLINVFLMAVVV